MMEFHFNAELAQKYGVDGAIFLHCMAFWVAKNRANGRHFHEGRYWTYNTLEALAKMFPFWTRRQIERIVGKLKDDGALLVGDFNEDKTDRTRWYALADSVLEAYGETLPPISRNGEMHFTESGQPFHETGKCNKETVGYQLYPPIVPQGGPRKKKRSKSIPEWKPERFEKFWSYYPRHEDRVSAVREWDKLKPEDALIDQIARALLWQTKDPDWPVPYACRYLKNQRWTDEPPKPKPAAQARPAAQQMTGWHMEVIDGEEVMVPDGA
ncbi:MAG: hypothetical protein E7E26_09320 [Clostridiales bacterium]|nr:hypothetical protein [Flavonifractor sp.]MDU2195939.1 hypothetical protein [Clostridiales bacterium]